MMTPDDVIGAICSRRTTLAMPDTLFKLGDFVVLGHQPECVYEVIELIPQANVEPRYALRSTNLPDEVRFRSESESWLQRVTGENDG